MSCPNFFVGEHGIGVIRPIVDLYKRKYFKETVLRGTFDTLIGRSSGRFLR